MKEWLASLPKKRIIVLAILFCISVLLLSFLYHQSWEYWVSMGKITDPTDQIMAKNDFIRTVAQILGGAFFILTIVFTYLNWKANQEKNITDLFTKAIEQLGNEKSLDVRLGGIYALERIARDSKKDHWTIMEVLTAFVREKAKTTTASEATPLNVSPPDSRKEVPTKPAEQAPEENPKPKADIQAVLTVLGRTAIPFAAKGEKRRLDLSATDLRGADLKDANLQGADLGGANLQGAKLWKANLQEANLWGANLQGADLMDANLQVATLCCTNLQMAKLYGVNLHWADLFGANLQGADFRGPPGLNLVKGLTSEQVAKAFWDKTTKWPKGFSPPAPEMLPPKEEMQKKE